MDNQLALALNIPPPKAHPLPENWKPFDLVQLPALRGVVALDLETKDLGISAGIGSSWAHPGAGFVCGVSIAWAGGAFYLPVTHSSGNVLIWEVQQWLREQALNPDVTFVMANSTYDVGWLWRWGIVPVNPPFDVQGMATLLDEHRTSYSLDKLAWNYLGKNKGTDGLVSASRDIGIPHPMSHMDRLPAWIVEPYAVDDAVLTLALYHHLMPMIEAQGLTNILDIERRASMAAGDMRRRGVRVDVDKAERIKQGFILLRDAAIADIARITGVNVTPWDNVAILQALRVENPALVVDHTPTGKEALRKEFVDALGTPVAKAVAHARHLDKSINTFFDGFIHKYAYRDRIHAEFHTLRRTDDEGYGYGTITGRLSCVTGDTQILTSKGMRRADEITVGTSVWTHLGRWRLVSHAWRVGVRPLFKVALSNGHLLHCTANHRVLCSTGEWKTIGEIHASIKTVVERSCECDCRAEFVSKSGSSPSAGYSPDAAYNVREREGGRCTERPGRREKGVGCAALLQGEDRRAQRDAGEIWPTAPQLEGRGVRSEGAHDNPTDGGWSGVCSSESDGRSIRCTLSAEGLGCPSHRRERGEQSHRQSGVGHKDGAPAYPLLAGSGNTNVEIAWIADHRSGEVFDFTVEDDESYLSEGVFSHNCSNPNLQQIPARDPEIGPAIRSCFLPEEGEQWLSADYSSQEPRWTIHYAAMMNLPGAAAMVERFRVDPRTDLHGETAALMGVKRTPAKTINLAIAYGAGGAKICHQLGLPTRMKEINGRMIEIAGAEGQALIDRHAEAVPYIRGLAKAAKQRAESQGYVTSYGGRRMRFKRGGILGMVEQSHKALNKLIQSCAATQNKIALARLRDAGIPVMISIHDSAEVSVPLGVEGERMKSQIVEIMESAVELLVPSVVDVKVGPDWGSLK